jgi:hypothetical protein
MTNHQKVTYGAIGTAVFFLGAFLTVLFLFLQCRSEKKQCRSEKKQCDTEKKQCDTEKKQCDTEKKQCDTEKKQCTDTLDKTLKAINEQFPNFNVPDSGTYANSRMKGYARRSFAAGTGCPCDGRGCTGCKDRNESCVICEKDEKTGAYLDNAVACTSKAVECNPIQADANDYYYNFKCGVCKNLEKDLSKNADQYADLNCENTKDICNAMRPNAERYTELGCSQNITAVCASNNIPKVNCQTSIIAKRVDEYTRNNRGKAPSPKLLESFQEYASRFQWVDGKGCKSVCAPGQEYTQARYDSTGKYITGSGGCRMRGEQLVEYIEASSRDYQKLIDMVNTFNISDARKSVLLKEIRQKEVSDKAKARAKALKDVSDKKSGKTSSAFRGPIRQY